MILHTRWSSMPVYEIGFHVLKKKTDYFLIIFKMNFIQRNEIIIALEPFRILKNAGKGHRLLIYYYY